MSTGDFLSVQLSAFSHSGFLKRTLWIICSPSHILRAWPSITASVLISGNAFVFCYVIANTRGVGGGCNLSSKPACEQLSQSYHFVQEDGRIKTFLQALSSTASMPIIRLSQNPHTFLTVYMHNIRSKSFIFCIWLKFCPKKKKRSH